MRAAPILLLIALLLPGCAAIQDLLGSGGPLAFELPVAVSTDAPGAEPVIAVAPDGTVYVEGIGRQGNGNVNKVFRSDDAGKHWTDITPPGPGTERSNDGFLAVGDDGAVYASNVFSLTFQLFRSDDRGATWTRLNLPPMPPLMHRHWVWPVGSTLHVTIEALPPSFVPFLAGAPPLPTAATDARAGMWYLRSNDKGTTWSVPIQIDPFVNFAGQSNMVVSGDGQGLYVGRYQEEAAPPDYSYDDGHWYMLASEDGGTTWERREMFDLTTEMSTAVPGLARTADGALWFAWSQEYGGNSTVHLASSRDNGTTWSEPTRPIGANGTHAMAWAAASPDGDVGLMWYAADTNGTASLVNASWNVHYAKLSNGTAQAQTNVTTTSVHEGNICARGPACRAGEDRRLLDYPWMDFGPDGAAYLVFPSTKWDKPSAFAVVAKQKL